MSRASEYAETLATAETTIRGAREATPANLTIGPIKATVTREGGLNISQGGNLSTLETIELFNWIKATFVDPVVR